MESKEKAYLSKLRSEYNKETSKIEEIKELDNRVKRPARIFAYTFGSIGSLILGFGMCIAIGEILEEYLALGIIIGLIGIFIVTINYFIYSKILISRKNKYSDKIIELSDKLLNE